MFLLQSGFSVHRGGRARPAQPSACEEPGLGGTLCTKPGCLQLNEMKNEMEAEGLVQPVSALRQCLKG